MLKVQVQVNENKIIADGIYSVKNFWDAIQKTYTSTGVKYTGDGYFIGSDDEKDFARFWQANLALAKADWFLDNVSTWLWYNSDDADDPEDFSIEDMREHYLAKRKKGA